MTIEFNDTLASARANIITAFRDAAATAGMLRIYNGARPAKGGAATTLLAELTFSDPSAGAASAGVLTANVITADASANTDGVASWYREVDGDGIFVMDGDCGLTGSGADAEFNTLNISTGQPVSATSNVLTEGNL